MNMLKALPLCLAALFPVAANALDYTSTFSDNGNITTETRTYNAGLKAGLTEIWEWLDLTITNGFSYDEIVADLADDNRLNHSVASLANANQVADVLGLSAQEQGGWAYATIQDVADQYSAFFDININPYTYFFFGSNVASVERYIGLFGDTYHEGLDDIGGFFLDVNQNLANIGFSWGISNTSSNYLVQDAGAIYDEQYIWSSNDIYTDSIFITTNIRAQGRVFYSGSYLTRQAPTTKVSEPATISLFALALTGLVAFRRKQGQK